MITNFRIYETYSKDKKIIYTFKTKAISKGGDGKDYEYTVHILQGRSDFPDDYGHLILSIEYTPASWYISTLIEHGSFYNSKAVIDGGTDWTVDNWREISKEFFEVLPDLEIMVAANKYNL